MKPADRSKFMTLALETAVNSVGVSRPNPAVGAVVVKDGNLVSKGATQTPGNAHAEVMALSAAGELAKGSDLFVTLEPCCHFGRTPPCTSAIIAAGVRRVFFACGDPNPLVRGKSRQILEDAGIEVFEGVEACGAGQTFAEVSRFFEGYFHFVKTGAPLVEVKTAVTGDYKLAGKAGSPIKITGKTADLWVHKLRSYSDAILVGVRTANLDNPLLNVRLCAGNSPVKILFGLETKAREDLQMLKAGARVLLFSRSAPSEDSGYEFHELPGSDFRENWNFMLSELARRGMHRLMIEPGKLLAENLLQSGLWHRYDLIVSKKLEPDGLDFPKFALEPQTREPLGEDELLVYRNS